MRTKSRCREDIHYFYSCKYNGITGAYHGKKKFTQEKIMAIKRDLYDFHSDNIIQEVRKHVLKVT